MPSTQKRQASPGRAAQEQAPVAESNAPAATGEGLNELWKLIAQLTKAA